MPRSRVARKGLSAARARAAASAPADGIAPASEAELHRLLAQRVRLARSHRGMTRKQLAEQSDISLAYLARLEAGTGNISLGLLYRLALALNLPLESFLSQAETQNADYALILEFLRHRPPGELARIRRQLFESFEQPASRSRQRIALLGIRGVGKSTLGPLLAGRLGIPFIELNREIEREAGVTLGEIFNVYGQDGYRQLERRCLEQAVVSYPKVVLATGGGIVTEPATYELLMSSFFTVWLKAKPQLMFERVMAQHDARIARPKLRGEAMDYITRTLETRKPLYERADLTLETSDKTIDQVLRALLAALSAAGNRRRASDTARKRA